MRTNKMIDFDEFADLKNRRIHDLERKMACAYLEAVEKVESASMELRKTMRVDDSMLPYFLPEYEDPALAMDAAEDRLAEIQSDIENFVGIVGSYSRRDIAQKLHRCKLDIANAKRKTNNVRKRAAQENPNLSPNEIEKLAVVKAAFTERETKIAELKPIMTDLERILSNAKEILIKYQ
jgi:hypothetical protein